jgi:hypothetical protein
MQRKGTVIPDYFARPPTYPCNPIAALHRPCADSCFSIFIAELSDILARKAAPTVIRGREKLNSLHLIAFFCKWPDVAVEQIMLAVQILEELTAR